MAFSIEKLPTTDEELYWYTRLRFGVCIPRTPVCPDHVPPFRAFADAYFGRNSIDPKSAVTSMALWHGSRGLSGKSFMLSLLAVLQAELLGADVNLLGGSLAQSMNIHEHVAMALEAPNAPTYMIVAQTSTKIAYTNGARVRPLTASQKTVRGPHPPRLLCVAGWTRVQTPDGPLGIDELCVGHTVSASRDMATTIWDDVRAVADRGYKRTIVVDLSNGTELTCTPDHRVATARGWVEAQNLTQEDVLVLRERTIRSPAQHQRPVRDLLHGREVDPPEDLRHLRGNDRRQGTAQVVDVPGLLGGRGGPSARGGNDPLRPVRDWPDRLDRDPVPHLPQQQPSRDGWTLPGLRRPVEGQHDSAVSSMPPPAHVFGQSGGALRRGPRDGQGRGSHVQVGDLRGGTVGLAGQDLPARGPLWALDPGLRPGRGADGDRGARGLLARPSGQRGARSGEAPDAGGGRLPSAVLAHRQDPPVVVGLRPGPLTRCWDITTGSGTFFADDVLVHNCDEIDEMELKVLDAALGQPLPQMNYLNEIVEPFAVLCSTWQNPQGTFTEIMRRAEEKGIPVYKWCFLESANPIDGWLTNKAIEEKRTSIPKVMWETEYELNEPSVGNRAFDTASVDRTFSLAHEPDPENGIIGYLRGQQKKDFEEYVYEHPQRGGVYGVGADWAKEMDYTVIVVGRLDVVPHRIVYYMKVNRRPYPQMIGFFNKAINRYHAKGIHDGTGGGDVVDDYTDLRAEPFIMSGADRDNMLTEYVAAVESDQWRIPRIPSAYIAHKYARVGDLYHSRTKGFHLPDEVCAMGLLHHLAHTKAPIAGPGEMERRDAEPTALEKQLDRPPGRFGDVTSTSEREHEYSLSV